MSPRVKETSNLYTLGELVIETDFILLNFLEMRHNNTTFK